MNPTEIFLKELKTRHQKYAEETDKLCAIEKLEDFVDAAFDRGYAWGRRDAYALLLQWIEEGHFTGAIL